MQRIDRQLVYSATDLVAFLECRHLTGLERAALAGHIERPMRDDPVLDRIALRGREHEVRFLADRRAEGLEVTSIVAADEGPLRGERIIEARDATLEAMRGGVEVIYQAVLFEGRRLGFADFLRRVETPSDLGAWSYEVWDTKLARHAKATAVLQIGLYSEMVGALQGRTPDSMHLALGGVARETVSFRVADYAAYTRFVAHDLEALLDAGEVPYPLLTAPEPVEHCDVCRWQVDCRAQWRREDDLSLVANLTSRQRRALHAIDVTTRLGLAEPAEALPERIEGAGRDALRRIQAQAGIQVRGERVREVISERIEPPTDREGDLEPNHGLLMLPEPSPGDLFFDIEGDPFFSSPEVDGIDYLFGVIEPRLLNAAGAPAFHAFWAVEDGRVTPAAERRAFEAFIDLVIDRLKADPALHVYHYAPYEPTAVKRLAGRYGTREAEVDSLLRGGVFVDLYRAVRQGVRASVESYSIKRLEPLYGFKRDIDLRDANSSIIEFETWLELGQGAERDQMRANIEAYNRDDCVSTLRLRGWLEEQRAALALELDVALPRPGIVAPEEREDSEAQRQVQVLVDQLLATVPADLDLADEAGYARWLLAQLVQWHRREHKSMWWRYFYLKNELTDEDRRYEPDAIGELTYVESWKDEAPGARSHFHRFAFPPQEHKIQVGKEPHDPLTGKPAGMVAFIDDEAGFIDLRLGSGRPAPTATSLIPLDRVEPHPKPEALQRLAHWVLEHGIDAAGDFQASRDLLLRRRPDGSPRGGVTLVRDGEAVQDAARRLALGLDRGVLAVQGPPGSGKSSVGARMIVDLVAAGKRVGVTANSHKVIGELLEKAAAEARTRGLRVRIAQRADDEVATDSATPLTTSQQARNALVNGDFDVVGGTAWLWAHHEVTASVDVLFIDEAGQMSLADAVAASLGAKSLVLLGDPQQLEQPLQGTHPPGAGGSALAHMLCDAHVMPADLGLFLDGTWRLHPRIAAYTSEVFYDGLLHSWPGRESLNVEGRAPLSGAGLRFVRVEHERNASESLEEAAAIAAHVRSLLEAGARWTDAAEEPRSHRLEASDVLLITPYNAQVAALTSVLPGLRIGTVDKFQGQEAPIAIYSMATSSADEAPRGMEFLYSLNRLNVATSRAQCLAVVVASPDLLRVTCRTPRQMQLVNALARFVELAEARPEPLGERPHSDVLPPVRRSEETSGR